MNISFNLVFILCFLFSVLFCFIPYIHIANVFLINHVQWILAFINISRIRNANEEVTPSLWQDRLYYEFDRLHLSCVSHCWIFLDIKRGTEHFHAPRSNSRRTVLSIVIPRVPFFKGNLKIECDL